MSPKSKKEIAVIVQRLAKEGFLDIQGNKIQIKE